MVTPVLCEQLWSPTLELLLTRTWTVSFLLQSSILKKRGKKSARDGGNWLTGLTNKAKKPKHNKKRLMPLIFFFELSDDWQPAEGYSCEPLDFLWPTQKQFGVYVQLQRCSHYTKPACFLTELQYRTKAHKLQGQLCCSTGAENLCTQSHSQFSTLMGKCHAHLPSAYEQVFLS